MVATVYVVVTLCAEVAAQVQPPEILMCASAPAVSFTLGKTQARKHEEGAKFEALTALGRQVWSDALRSDSAGGLAGPGAERAYAVLRGRYHINDLLAGGHYEFGDDESELSVEYCIPRDVYRSAKTEIQRQRRETVEALRLQFVHLEQLIGEGDYDTASAAMTELDLQVVSEALEQTPYISQSRDRTRSFYVWLLEWSDIVPRGPEFVNVMNDSAEQLIGDGQLESADRYVSEALKADRQDERALELRYLIQDLRAERAALLRQAKDLASRGRFSRAGKKLDEARVLSTDDPLGIEEAAKEIVGFRAQFVEHNPPNNVLLYGGFGTLGVDTTSVERRIAEATGLRVDGSPTLSFGLGGIFGMGRNGMLTVTGSWGLTEDDVNSFGGASVILYETAQLTGGVGYRTLRSEKKNISLQFTAGVAWEWAEADTVTPTFLKDSGSQVAYFIRIGAHFKKTLIFVQHGFGFKDSTGSLIGWDNNFQFGFGGTF